MTKARDHLPDYIPTYPITFPSNARLALPEICAGSPGGYFIQPGDPKKWVVFHQGGGWCTNINDCAARVSP